MLFGIFTEVSVIIPYCNTTEVYVPHCCSTKFVLCSFKKKEKKEAQT